MVYIRLFACKEMITKINVHWEMRCTELSACFLAFVCFRNSASVFGGGG